MSCKDWTAVVRTPSGRLEHVDFRSVSVNRGDAIIQAKQIFGTQDVTLYPKTTFERREYD